MDMDSRIHFQATSTSGQRSTHRQGVVDIPLDAVIDVDDIKMPHSVVCGVENADFRRSQKNVSDAYKDGCSHG